MKRSELKSLVREIVIEILQEGVGKLDAASSSQPFTEAKQPVRQLQQRRPQRPAFDAALDTPVAASPVSEAHDIVKQTLGCDDSMAALLASSAETMRKQANAPTAGDGAARFTAEHAPDELFEGANKWAKLAFVGPAPSGQVSALLASDDIID